MDKTVFGWAFGIIVAVCVAGVTITDKVGEWSQAALNWVTGDLGWLYILAASAFVVFSLVLAFGRYGRIPLSRHGEPPEFSTTSWVARMSIGLPQPCSSIRFLPNSAWNGELIRLPRPIR